MPETLPEPLLTTRTPSDPDDPAQTLSKRDRTTFPDPVALIVIPLPLELSKKQ